MWRRPDPDDQASDWLVRGDDDGTRIAQGFCLEGDEVVHLGWTARLTVEGGVPLPVVERMLALVAAAVEAAIEGFDDPEYRFG